MAPRRKNKKIVNVIVPKLLPHTKVEVRSLEDGFLGSWHPATVISSNHSARNVIYDHLLADDGTDYLTECVKVSSFVDGEYGPDTIHQNYRGIIRPSPPAIDLRQWSLHYGQCVDMYHNDAWWEGIIFDHEDGSEERKVFFPDIGDEVKTSLATLRITQDWDEILDIWKPRGNWLFLELVEEIEKRWPLLVSVKQIWYDTRVTGFPEIKEWTNNDKDTWRIWVKQVWYNNLKMAIKQVFNELDSSGLLHEGHNLFELSELDLDDILKAGASPEKNFPIVPFKFPVPLNSDENASHAVRSLDEEELLLQSASPRPSTPNQCLQIISEESGKGTRNKIEWLPVPTDMLPEPGLYPDAVLNYGDGLKKTKSFQKIRAHLLCLKWKIYFNKNHKSRMRYVSPEGDGYHSLREVCWLLKEQSEFLSPLPEDKQRSPSLYNQKKSKCLKSTWRKRKSSYCRKARKSCNRVEGPNSDDVNASMDRQAVVVRDGPEKDVFDFQPTELEFGECSFKQGCLSEKNQAESSSGMLLLENPAEHNKAEESGWRNDGAADISPRRTRSKIADLRLQYSGSTPKPLINLGKNGFAHGSKRVLRSSTRAIQEDTPSVHTPRTVLSWLIDNNVVVAGEEVYYRERDSDAILLEGKITRDGIKCCCCHCTFSINKFEVHAIIKFRRASGNIFLKDGRSLFDCQLQLEREKKSRCSRMKSRDVKVNSKITTDTANDYICSVCHDGGDLVLCDQCPSSYHKECINMKVIPEGDWFCPSCCCGICDNQIDRNMEFMGGNTCLSCSQCERQYHIRCVKDKGLMQKRRDLNGLWFCNKNCGKGLHQLLGKAIPVADGNLTWTLAKYKDGEYLTCDDHHDRSSVATYSKLSVALGVMHECFLPVKESLTNSDIIEDMIFCRRSELRRLSFQGFYTILLEKDDEMVTTASVRVYGDKMAEVPFVATRFHYRRKGMCRILMDELEKQLMQLGVERLTLPAVEATLDTWTSSFGFSKMTMSDRLNFLSYTSVFFPGAIMCQKLLQENSAHSEVHQAECIEDQEFTQD